MHHSALLVLLIFVDTLANGPENMDFIEICYSTPKEKKKLLDDSWMTKKKKKLEKGRSACCGKGCQMPQKLVFPKYRLKNFINQKKENFKNDGYD